jgi:hypothetical protein
MVKSEFFPLPLETKRSYEIPELWDKEVMFLWNRTHKGRKEGDLKEFWHLDSMCLDSKYAAEYPENVEVKELTSF